MPSPALTLRLFGPLQVLVDGEPMPRVRARSTEWLLALLALRHGRTVARSWLAGTLWPESDESQALHNLRNALVYLRKALGREGARLRSPTRDTLTLNLAGAEVDVVRFDAALKAGDEAALQGAVALHTGPLLEGCYEAWASLERESREQACLRALETLADRAGERGAHEAAIRHLRQAQALDPLRDTTARRLMTALEANGDPAAAIEVYRGLRKRLHEALSGAPDEATSRLFQAIRTRARQGAEQKLRASGAAEYAAPAPPSPSSGYPVSRPPHSIARMIGREQEVRDVRQRLRQNRLVTLVGAGGVGKTRLAMEVAALAAEQCEGGAIWVELAPLAEGALLLPTLAVALGVRPEGASDAETLLDRLVAQLVDGDFLLALDNCEHLLDDAAFAVQRLLSRCPDLRILATSRQRLGVMGEVAWRVPSLPVPEVEPLPADPVEASAAALTFPAVQLFVERAASAGGGFQLTRRDEVEAVCRICRRLDGIPLAVELAAARVGSLTPRDINARLDQRFQLLTGGFRTALPRQQTLKSLIDWSYELLNDAEKALLCRLSVFSGGWTLEAAEAVCAEGSGFRVQGSGSEPPDPNAVPPEPRTLNPEPFQVLDLLTSLVEKSLVLYEAPPPSDTTHHAPLTSSRYRLLETMRQYGVERLAESGESEALRHRHCDFYLQLAEEVEPRLYGPDQSVWYDYLENDYDNLRVALEWCQREESADRALRLAVALSPFWDVRGYFKEGKAHLTAALSRKSSLGSAVRARVFLAAGQLSIRQGDCVQGRSFLEESLAIQRELGNRQGIAGVLNELAHVALYQGDYAWGISLGEESLAISQDLGGSRKTIGALNILAHLARHQGDHALARSRWEACLAMQRQSGDQRGIAGSSTNLGLVAHAQGDYALARSFLEESLAIQRELGERIAIIHALGALGHVAREMGDHARAGFRYKESLALRRELGDAWLIALSLEDFGVLAGRQKQHERATRLLGAAEALCQTLGRTPPSTDPGKYAHTVDSARAALGEEAFAEAWEKGRAMSLERAIAEAREEVRSPVERGAGAWVEDEAAGSATG